MPAWPPKPPTPEERAASIADAIARAEADSKFFASYPSSPRWVREAMSNRVPATTNTASSQSEGHHVHVATQAQDLNEGSLMDAVLTLGNNLRLLQQARRDAPYDAIPDAVDDEPHYLVQPDGSCVRIDDYFDNPADTNVFAPAHDSQYRKLTK